MAFSPGLRISENGISPGIAFSPPPLPVGTSIYIAPSSRLSSTYDFGYNIGSKGTWNDIWSSSLFPDLLDQLSPKHIRYPSGVMNYWDWNTQTTNTQYELASDTLPASELLFYKNLIDPLNINTLLGVNMLTSSVANGTPLLNQQSASLLNITNSINIPVTRVELGSEFYTTATPLHAEKYPSGSDYGREASQWMTTLRTILPSTKYAVPMVDTKFSGTNRRLSWNSQSIAEFIGSSSIPDAFVFHSYPIVTTANYDGITDFILTGSYDEYIHVSESISKLYSWSPLLSNSEFWITEYNLTDDSPTFDKRISGTWAHGLYNLSFTLRLMDHPDITVGTNHSTHAGVFYGAIFDDTNVFGSSGTSDKFDFSAVGTLMGYLGTAYKDCDSFSNITSSLDGLIGKVFISSTSGDKFILMNLFSGSYSLNLSDILSGRTISSITASYAEPTLLVNKITGSGKLTISQSFYTGLSNQEILAYNMQPYEVTYIKCNI